MSKQEIDYTKIRPGDKVKLSFRSIGQNTWIKIKGWQVVEGGGLGQSVIVAGFVVFNRDMPVVLRTAKVRAHKSAHKALPQIPAPTLAGTRFKATVRGCPNQTVFVINTEDLGMLRYVTSTQITGNILHTSWDITDVHDVEPPR